MPEGQDDYSMLIEALKKMPPPAPAVPGISVRGEQRCVFEGLPPGTYMLSCPCPRHSVRC